MSLFYWQCEALLLWAKVMFLKNFLCIIYRSKLDVEEMKTAKAIRKSVKSISNTSLEQAAYYRGLSVIKGFDLAKYKKEVADKMAAANDEDDDSDRDVSQKATNRKK